MSKPVVIIILVIIVLLGGFLLSKPVTANARQAIADCYSSSKVITTVKSETTNSSIEVCAKAHDSIQAFNTCMNQARTDHGDMKTTLSLMVSPLNKDFSVDTIRENHNQACTAYPEMQIK
ncbi:MAG: hypothetical protein M3Q44_06225 [bacterium]|nr:hypothetical protein [bacterium]